MKAAHYTDFGSEIAIVNTSIPSFTSDSALIEVKATGICKSDWQGWKGFDPDIIPPHVPGHEFSGVIHALGSDVRKWVGGERVTVPFVCGCGTCEICESGNPQVCRNQTQPGFTHWGSFAEYVVVHNADFNLVPIPSDMTFTEAAILGCRFGTAFRAVIDRGGLSQGDWLLVFGCGGVGQCAIRIGSALDARIIAVDISDQKLERAASLGAEYCINISREEFMPVAIRSLSEGGIHVSLDAVGRAEYSNLGTRCLRPLGRHIQVGLPTTSTGDGLNWRKIAAAELEMRGSHGIQASRFDEMTKFVRKHNIDLRHLITDITTLDRGVEILKNMDSEPPLGIAVIEMNV